VRVGDKVRAEWGKVVIEGDVLQVRDVLGDVWASIGGLPEKNLTYCSRILLLDRPDPDAPLVETIAQAILRHDTEGVVEWERCSGQGTYRGEARAVLDAIRAEWTIEPKAVQS
jgi:hypothetical protein